MSKNCLVTRLAATVDNNNLQKIDEMAILVQSVSSDNFSLGGDFNKIKLRNRAAFTVRVTDGGSFSTSSDLSNAVTQMSLSADTDVTLYFSNGNYKIYISNKGTLRTLVMTGVEGMTEPLFHCDMKELSGCTVIDTLDATYRDFYGNVDVLGERTMTSLIFLKCSNVTGDISNITVTANTNITGTKVYGDYSGLVGASGVRQIFNAVDVAKRDGAISVDMSKASNASSRYFNTTGLSTDQSISCSWPSSTSRSTEYYVLPMQSNGAHFDFGSDLDNMLINQAACTNNTNKSGANQTTIDVYGTKTSLSDSAVSTLKGYGYTIKVNGITL